MVYNNKSSKQWLTAGDIRLSNILHDHLHCPCYDIDALESNIMDNDKNKAYIEIIHNNGFVELKALFEFKHFAKSGKIDMIQMQTLMLLANNSNIPLFLIYYKPSHDSGLNLIPGDSWDHFDWLVIPFNDLAKNIMKNRESIVMSDYSFAKFRYNLRYGKNNKMFNPNRTDLSKQVNP